MNRLNGWIISFMAVAVVACATPTQRIDAFARASDFTRAEVIGGPFQHVVFYNAAAQQVRVGTAFPIRRVHVYLEGDGTPWLEGSRVAADPTPRDPLALRLMARDAAPAVYLGRPCYHGHATAPSCSPLLWTHARYGVAVVDRMAIALRRVIADLGNPRVVLVGYSGGGVIAMLLAARLEYTDAVVTVAANLDVDAWAAHHQYSPLSGSLNPAREAPLPARIAQTHLIGGRDTHVPPTMITPVVARQPNAGVVLHEEFDHVCCWVDAWPDILAETLRPR